MRWIMNKYKYIYCYLKNVSEDVEIYYVLYNEENNKFYEVEFDTIYDYFDELGYDDFGLKVGEEIELPSSKVSEINSLLVNTYLRLIYKLIQVKENSKLLKKVAFLGLTIFLTSCSASLTKKYIIPSVMEFVEENHEKNKAMPSSFDNSIYLNATLNHEISGNLKRDLDYLVSRTSIYNNTSHSIKKRIDKYNFYKVNKENYNECLAYILFGEDSKLATIIASDLSSASQDAKSSDIGNLFGLISIEFRDDDLIRLMNKGIKEYDNILMDNLGITKEEAQELIVELEEYSETLDINIKENINKKLSSYLVKKYQNTSISTPFRENLLSSELYNGIFSIYHNIFSENIIVEVIDSKYGNYNLYFDELTKEDVSINVYKEKLLELIKEKGTHLDYNDADCRFIYYLYYLCFIDGYHSNYEEVLAVKDLQDISNMMVDKVFGTNGFVSLNKEFLYSYLCNGKTCMDDLAHEVLFIEEYSFDVALFREYEICIEKELDAGNITQEEYNELINEIENWINRKIARENEELYNEYIRAINEDDSIFSEFSILGDYEYRDEKLKQYEYKAK